MSLRCGRRVKGSIGFMSSHRGKTPRGKSAGRPQAGHADDPAERGPGRDARRLLAALAQEGAAPARTDLRAGFLVVAAPRNGIKLWNNGGGGALLREYGHYDNETAEPGREELLQVIADLDDQFAAGEIAEKEYGRRRQALKEQLMAVWHV